MSNSVDVAYVKGYHAAVERLLQQEDTKFKSRVRNEPQSSEKEFFEQIDKVEAREVTQRFAPSPVMDTPHLRRVCTMRPYDVGDFLDKFDKVKMLIDPTNDYTKNFVAALNRKRDDVIIGAFFATSWTGKEGDVAVTFPTSTSTNVVPVDFGGAGNAGLTVKKLRRARTLLKKNLVDLEKEKPLIAVNAEAIDDLLSEVQVGSVDYNSVKPLVDGEIAYYMGFTFVPTERLEADSSGYRRLPVWVPSAMLHTTGIEIKSNIAERSDVSFNWYAYACAMFGATRMQEGKVIEIKMDEAV